MVIEARVLHRTVIVQNRVGAQVDIRRKKLLDQRIERIRLGQTRNLIAELKLLEDVLHVRREPIEIRLEVGFELLLVGTSLEVAQRELRCIVEGLSGGLAQWLVLMNDLGLVERLLHVEHVLLRRLKQSVETAQDGHRKDDIAVFASHIKVAKYIVSDAPDEIGNPIEIPVAHAVFPLQKFSPNSAEGYPFCTYKSASFCGEKTLCLEDVRRET